MSKDSWDNWRAAVGSRDGEVTSVTVKVPATSANLGPGFDCLGLAVDLWNELTVERAPAFSLMITGEGSDAIPKTKENFVVVGLELVFEKFGLEVPTLAYFCKNGIPFGSGLGSSSAAIVSGMLAGLVLAGKELPVNGQEALLQMAAQVEGHIDNLAPCIYGGLQLGVHADDRWTTTTISTPANIQLIVFTPTSVMSTHEARAMLPAQIDRTDAVFNIGRLGLLINAMTTNNLDALRVATQDALHQPIRGQKNVMPWLNPIISAALAAGAKGAFLSGAGSSVMAIAEPLRGDRFAQCREERNDSAIATAMKHAAEDVDTKGRVFVTRSTDRGAHVTEVVTDGADGVGSSHDSQGMRYRSTRDATGATVSFGEAVMQGLAPDGGLYVPMSIPKIDEQTLARWRHLSYTDLAVEVMSKFIGKGEIQRSQLRRLVEKSYSAKRGAGRKGPGFSTKHVVPLRQLSPSICIMEQFHGPTCAFKDVALQFLGNTFEFLLAKENHRRLGNGEAPKRLVVLGATSGDTGSAAIEGLRGKRNIDVFILFPQGRVAPVQEAQMTTVADSNVHCVAVDGVFDDCQDVVKKLFCDKNFNNATPPNPDAEGDDPLAENTESEHSVTLGAVNSINWARILAQIVYYFYGYFRWLDLSSAEARPRTLGEDKVTFAVPSGNFGNALAGFYARSMGLPIHRLAVCTNENDILHRFFADGDYSVQGRAQPTLAPAMDITKSSNFERFLFHLLDGDAAQLASCMSGLNATGRLDLGNGDPTRAATLLARARAIFVSARASDANIHTTTESVRSDYGCVCRLLLHKRSACRCRSNIHAYVTPFFCCFVIKIVQLRRLPPHCLWHLRCPHCVTPTSRHLWGRGLSCNCTSREIRWILVGKCRCSPTAACTTSWATGSSAASFHNFKRQRRREAASHFHSWRQSLFATSLASRK
eukprot:INCI4180.5.p1 GENE.INCI4180.5~~INCI4180.5.p1  ORF type:complete len:932 (-),score=122.48 INCI4180.5:218-3013(-)